jgi:hypothetical protein
MKKIYTGELIKIENKDGKLLIELYLETASNEGHTNDETTKYFQKDKKTLTFDNTGGFGELSLLCKSESGNNLCQMENFKKGDKIKIIHDFGESHCGLYIKGKNDDCFWNKVIIERNTNILDKAKDLLNSF